MAPNKHFKLNTILTIIREHTEGPDGTNWDLLVNNIFRYMNEDIPTISGLTEQFCQIAENMDMDPILLEQMSWNSGIPSSLTCMKILRNFDIENLVKCRLFLSTIA